MNNTNNYATETILDSEDMRENWLHTNAEEMMAFLGVVVFMGIVKLPKVSMYFSADPRIYQVAVASVFSRNRFFQLLKYLHVSSPTEVPAREHPDYKLYRIKPLTDTLSQTFQQMYNPHREQSIDEAMVKYKGRVKFLQYMPMKPCKRGIKIWCRCDPHNGYLSQLEIYMGKDDAHENQTSAGEGQTQTPQQGLGARVVTNLTRCLVGKNYFVFMDNFFTGIDLSLSLLREKTYCCGMVRENRKGFPPSLKGVKLANQGDSKFARHGNLVCTIWRDKAKTKNVALLSTQYRPNQFSRVKRKRKRGGRSGGYETITINKPRPLKVQQIHGRCGFS